MVNYFLTKKYCSEDISLIENFAEAATDTTETWDIHHRKEIEENKSRTQLEEENILFNRPANELIFLKHADHIRLHQEHRLTDEFKKVLSERMSGEGNPQYGVKWSDERRKKMSETRKARIANGQIKVDTSACHTEEACKKISEKAKERLANPENHPMFGKLQSDEAKKKISAKMKGRIPWNKGKKLNKRGQ